jgi:hypothetical protein
MGVGREMGSSGPISRRIRSWERLDIEMELVAMSRRSWELGVEVKGERIHS